MQLRDLEANGRRRNTAKPMSSDTTRGEAKQAQAIELAQLAVRAFPLSHFSKVGTGSEATAVSIKLAGATWLNTASKIIILPCAGSGWEDRRAKA